MSVTLWQHADRYRCASICSHGNGVTCLHPDARHVPDCGKSGHKEGRCGNAPCLLRADSVLARARATGGFCGPDANCMEFPACPTTLATGAR